MNCFSRGREINSVHCTVYNRETTEVAIYLVKISAAQNEVPLS